jgi:hypothetical protein
MTFPLVDKYGFEALLKAGQVAKRLNVQGADRATSDSSYCTQTLGLFIRSIKPISLKSVQTTHI